MLRVLSILVVAVLCGVAFFARCQNAQDVLVEGRIYFTDPDCYSRMTRVRAVAEGRGLFQRHHDFENWPLGTRPHTTAPMDWAIVLTNAVVKGAVLVFDPAKTSVLRYQTLDLAGALISPILGVLTCGWLGWWARTQRQEWGETGDVPDESVRSADSIEAGNVGNRSTARMWPSGAWLAPAFFFSISPILVHGTLLGRPDHQSLVIFLVAVALGAELRLARALSRNWGLAAGGAWACALWTSLYEPLVLFATVSAVWALTDRRRFAAREMRPGWIAFGLTLVVVTLFEGWRITWPDAAAREAFARWSQTIGELAPLDPQGPLLYRWLGAGVVFSPLLLGLVSRRDRLGWALGVSLVILFALTLWQLRWGYFLALGFAMSLPWQLGALRRAWIAWPAFLIALWPLAQDWDEKLFPDDHPELAREQRHGVMRLEAVRLREIAEAMRSPERKPFIAPWWLSPPLAYWSGQPGVAGSSHQSLPGIAQTARFFLAPGPDQAERVARELEVKWIVTDEADRLVQTSRQLLGESGSFIPYVAHLHEHGVPREHVNPEDLRAASPEARARLIEMSAVAEEDELGSPAFSCVARNQFYKLFTVQQGSP